MARRPLSNTENLLLVEGINDQHVCWQLFKYFALPDQLCQVEEGKGWENIRESLPQRLKAGNQKRLGIVVDADENIGSRWQSLSNVLHKAGYSNVPSAPDTIGTIIRPAEVNEALEQPPFTTIVGIWIMPNNVLPGALEEFIRFLVPNGDELWQVAQDTVLNLPGPDDFRSANWQSKARLYSWLAWQQEPGKPIGQAIASRYLNPEVAEARDFVNWVQRLFSSQ
ncbi:MAG: hypothetical protein OHK0029_07470 [Armatimonadaceae bacterium]